MPIPEQDKQTQSLFISYVEADRAWVEGYLLDALEAAGVGIYSEEAFRLGVPRLVEFERAIQSSQRTLLVLSPAYLANNFSQFTDLLAQSYGLETATWPVIPLILHPVKLPPRLAMLTALDATDPDTWQSVLERLLGDLQRPLPAPLAIPRCPYPGMVPFGETDSERFFGRNNETQELLQRLRLHPFITVIGPSGSGKSSLVFAGLVPALQRSRLFGSGEWWVRTMRPGETPLATLQNAIGEIIDLDNFQPMDEFPDRLLLVVDQFEEVFTLASDESDTFQEALLKLTEMPNVYVILTVRADFYPDLMASPLWSEVQAHRLEVLPLDEQGLRQAIVQPAEDAGVFVEAALVERLVADAADEPGILPLVQETLVLLWENLERRFLALRTYEALVLPRSLYGASPLTGLQVAMARRADAAFTVLATEQQVIARRIFLRLVQFGEGRADTRRQQSASALQSASDDPDKFESTLRHLVDNRLLTLSGEEVGTSRQVDIAHEALISGWPTLWGWLAERREAELTRRRLENKAAEWMRLGRGSGGLLDAIELSEADRWLSSPDAADLGYSQSLPMLMEASRAAIEKVEREREAIRQRELEQARNLAKEQERRAEAERQRAEDQAKSAGRLRRMVVALAVVFILAVIAAIFAVSQQRAAEQKERFARSGQLAAEAQSVLQKHPQRSLLLALEAVNVTAQEEEPRHPSAEQALRDALGWTGGLPLSGHNGAILATAYSHDGHWLATTGRDDTVRLWDVSGLLDQNTNVESIINTVHILRGHEDDIMTLDFGPDNRWLATGCADGSIRLWDVAPLLQNGADSQSQIAESVTLDGHEDVVTTVTFSPDGRWLVSGSWDATIKLWNVAEVLENKGATKATYTLEGHEGHVWSTAFSPDGLWLASASRDRTIRIWDVSILSEKSRSDSNQPEVIQVLRGHNGGVNAVAFSPDGQWLASGSEDNTAWIWDISSILNSSGSEVAPPIPLVLRGHRAWVTSVAFSGNGRWLVTGSDDGTARFWDLEASDPTSESRVLHGHEAPVTSVEFSPDGQWLVTGSGDHTARLWDVSTMLNNDLAAEHLVAEPLVLRGHGASIQAVAYDPKGGEMATATDNGTVWLWDVSSGEVSTMVGHIGQVSSLDFSPDGQWLATGGLDRKIGLWNMFAIVGTNHVSEPSIFYNLEFGVTAVVFSQDGNQLVVGGDDNAVRILNVPKLLSAKAQSDPEEIIAYTLRGHTDRISSVAISSDGHWLASGSRDGTARIWDVSAVRSDDKSVDTAALIVVNEDKEPITSVAFSPDGRWLVTGGGGWDTTARLWDISTQMTEGSHIRDASRILHGHASAVTAVAFSADGQWLATGSRDTTARLWDATTILDEKQNAQDTTAEPLVLQGHGDSVTTLAFSPDGRWLATGSLDNTVRVWRTALQDLKSVACRVAGRNLTLEEWEQYFRGQEYRRTCEEWPDHPTVNTDILSTNERSVEQ